MRGLVRVLSLFGNELINSIMSDSIYHMTILPKSRILV